MVFKNSCEPITEVTHCALRRLAPATLGAVTLALSSQRTHFHAADLAHFVYNHIISSSSRSSREIRVMTD